MLKAVVLLSGGMDSLVTTAVAARDNDEIFLLHVNYGQRTEKRELDGFGRIAEHFKPAGTLIADASYLSRIGGSALTDRSIAVPSHPGKGIPITYVPFRNANLLAIAVSWAEVLGAQRVYIGAVEEDSSGYPDCREIFYRRFQQAVDTGTKAEPRIELVTPVIYMSKEEIVRLGVELQVPFALSWSCYQNDDIACGKCDSCRLRLRAFRSAGVEDPIPYES